MASRSVDGLPAEAVFRYGISPNEIIIGLDEVGRGAWAGPVTAAAVALLAIQSVPGIDDSKRLRPARRVELDRLVRRRAIGVGLGWVSAVDVDAQGLGWAVAESGRRALADLGGSDWPIFVDGNVNYPGRWRRSTAVIGGDGLLVPIAAASVVAKVARDRYMERLGRQWPVYGFDRHVGYGTLRHRQAIAEFGLTPWHRRSIRSLGGWRP